MSQYSQPQPEFRGKPRVSQPQSTSRLAITSLILGVASFVCAIFTGLFAVISGIIALTKISGSNGRVGGTGLAIAGIVTGAVGCLWTLVLVGLLLPAVVQVRAAARRTVTMNNIRQINLANLNHESEHWRLASNLTDENPDGPANLSWRVHLLPYLGYQDLYSRFNLDEPWDSPNNKALLAEIPEQYQHPQVVLPEGYTVFQMPYSPASDRQNSALYTQGEMGPRFADITDGSSNTLMTIEVTASAAVPWTKPQDWQFDPNDPHRDIGDAFPGGFVVGFCDGATEFIPSDIPANRLKALLTRASGD